MLADAISQEQKQFFKEYGFIHFEDFINKDAVSLIINASLEVEKKWIENRYRCTHSSLETTMVYAQKAIDRKYFRKMPANI